MKVEPYIETRAITFEDIYGCSPDDMVIPKGYALTGKIVRGTNTAHSEIKVLTADFPPQVGSIQNYRHTEYRAELIEKPLTFKDLEPGLFWPKWKAWDKPYIKLSERDCVNGCNSVRDNGHLTHVDCNVPVEKYDDE